MADQSVRLYEVVPREQIGRDTAGRYFAQYRAASLKALELLESGANDGRVYCDMHDDFVVRRIENGRHLYVFFQVKTKTPRNYRWNALDLLGICKDIKKHPVKAPKVAASFIGRLVVHAVNFQDSCESVVFMTNVQMDDEIEEFIQGIASGLFDDRLSQALVACFNEAFNIGGDELSGDEIRSCLEKVVFEPGTDYILESKFDEFHTKARAVIYKFSEIDLQYLEAQEIAESLVDLVAKKSRGVVLFPADEEQLDRAAGVGIDDLLQKLSISKGAYEKLAAGGDEHAIKHASIIQRKLTDAGAANEVIESCSAFKVKWDEWCRQNRHVIPELQWAALMQDVHDVYIRWCNKEIAFSDVFNDAQRLEDDHRKSLAGTLTAEILFGGVMAALVRSESR